MVVYMFVNCTRFVLDVVVEKRRRRIGRYLTSSGNGETSVISGDCDFHHVCMCAKMNSLQI